MAAGWSAVLPPYRQPALLTPAERESVLLAREDPSASDDPRSLFAATTLSVADLEAVFPRHERAAFCAVINRVLAAGAVFANRVPVNPGLCANVLRSLRDGIVLAGLVNVIAPDTVNLESLQRAESVWRCVWQYWGLRGGGDRRG